MRYGMIAAVIALAARPAAADVCQAVALRDVPAIGKPGVALKKGDIDQVITQYNVDRLTGRTSYCSYGGSCFPVYVPSGNNMLLALRLTNCAVDTTKPDEEDGEISYGLLPNRSVPPPEAMRFEDLTDKLSDLGVCPSCAFRAAEFFKKHPDSRCATLVRETLAGNPASEKALDADPDFCNLEKLSPATSK